MAIVVVTPRRCDAQVIHEQFQPKQTQTTSTSAKTSAYPRYDVRPHRVQLIAPGTIVGDSAPKGWSHLVIKSQPICTKGDMDDVAQRDIRLAGLFSNVFLVDMGATAREPWAIRRIGFGVASKVGDADVVLAPGKEKELKAKVGFLGKILLNEIYVRQSRMLVRVTSPHFAVVDVEAAVRFSDTNQQMILRYFLVADPETRTLHACVCLLQRGSARHRLCSKARLLAPNYVEKCGLYVDKQHYSWGVPDDLAFAAMDIPQSAREFETSPNFVDAVQRVDITPNAAGIMDRELRAKIGGH